MAVTKLTPETLGEHLAGPLAVTEFGAPWCAPCRRLDPILKDLSSELPQVNFGSIDVDIYPELATEYQVAGVPVIVIHRDGQQVDRIIGLQPPQKLRQQIVGHIED